MITKVIRCDCGFVARSSNDDQLVADVQRHAKDQHTMNLSRDQVLSMAKPETNPTANNQTR